MLFLFVCYRGKISLKFHGRRAKKFHNGFGFGFSEIWSGDLLWRFALVEIGSGDWLWRSALEIGPGDLLWRSALEMWSKDLIWRFALEICSRDLLWRFNLPSGSATLVFERSVIRNFTEKGQTFFHASALHPRSRRNFLRIWIRFREAQNLKNSNFA